MNTDLFFQVQSPPFEAIIKYNGNGDDVKAAVQTAELLGNGFAVISGTAEQIKSLLSLPTVEYIEPPKLLTYQLSSSLYSVCATRAKGEPFGLTGKGTAVAIIDSGLDVAHPDFRRDDGGSRVEYLWDQSAEGTPPNGFAKGAEFTKEQIDLALSTDAPLPEPLTDRIGHGTAVAGVACGNGIQSGGRESGVAPQASIIVVKLGNRGFGGFPRTTEVMRGIKYALDKATALNMPLAINLSYGTNNGSHDGNSLFEQYVDSAADRWKTAIVAATGNEGDSGHHFSAVATAGAPLTIPFAVSGAPASFFMSLWKSFADTFTLRLTAPTGEVSPEITPQISRTSFTLSDTRVTVFYGQPTPLTQYQEIYFLFEKEGISAEEGLWQLTVTATEVVDGRFDVWLPTEEDVSSSTAFSSPDPATTLTLPSTARRVISVGGYDGTTNTAAAFSGRGNTRNDVYAKPDLVAPAVNILTTRSSGGYSRFTGTSVAAPFVTGACSLLMEWGIVRGNDPFLYGQRAKAYLQKGAKRPLPIVYPNPIWGFGTLCISGALDVLKLYDQGGLL